MKRGLLGIKLFERLCLAMIYLQPLGDSLGIVVRTSGLRATLHQTSIHLPALPAPPQHVL